MSSFTAADWAELQSPNRPPCANAVLGALGMRPNGPHDLTFVATYSGLSVDATAWMLGALERLCLITSDEREDLYLPIPF